MDRPDAALFDVDLGELERHARRRVRLLAAVARAVPDPFGMDAAAQLRQLDARLGFEARAMDAREDALGFWAVRFALTTPEEQEWHCLAELLLRRFLGAPRTRGVGALETRALTPELAVRLIRPLLRRHLPRLDAQTRICTGVDAAALLPLLHRRRFLALGGTLIFQEGEETLRLLECAAFMRRFHALDARCRALATDAALDRDFVSLARLLQRLRFGEQSLEPVSALHGGLTLANHTSLVARGAVPLCAARLLRHIA